MERTLSHMTFGKEIATICHSKMIVFKDLFPDAQGTDMRKVLLITHLYIIEGMYSPRTSYNDISLSILRSPQIWRPIVRIKPLINMLSTWIPYLILTKPEVSWNANIFYWPLKELPWLYSRNYKTSSPLSLGGNYVKSLHHNLQPVDVIQNNSYA